MILIKISGNNGEALQSAKTVLEDLLEDSEIETVCSAENGENEIEIFLNSDNEAFYVINPANRRAPGKIPNSKCTLITCGFNGKASVTASSIGEDGMQICIQRNIPTFSGYIEPQEFHAEITNMSNPETTLSVITAALIADAKTVLNIGPRE